MYGVVISSILAIWTFLLNIFILTLTLSIRNIRRYSIYSHVVSYSISNILQTIFVNTFTIYNDVSPWYLGVFLCRTWIILDVLIPFVSSCILILMNLGILCSFISLEKSSCVFRMKKTNVMTLVPWVVGCVIVLPLWLKGSVRTPYEEGQCVFALNMETAIASQILIFFVPLILAFILIVIIVIKHFTRERRDIDEEYSLQSNNENREIEQAQCIPRPRITKALGVVTSIFFIMWLPYQSLVLSLINCYDDSCVPSVALIHSTMLIGTATSGVVPTFWFIDANLRKKLKHILCR